MSRKFAEIKRESARDVAENVFEMSRKSAEIEPERTRVVVENVTETKFLQVAGKAGPLFAPTGPNGGANLHDIRDNGHVRNGRGFLGERFLPGRLADHVSSLCLCHGCCSAAKLEHPEWRRWVRDSIGAVG